jgi:hypothetical protein
MYLLEDTSIWTHWLCAPFLLMVALPSYDLARRIHDVKTYPVLSPQGATILIYAHENGVTLVWRGGRRFKKPKVFVQPPKPKQKQNGASEDAVMIIDSDDDQPPAKAKPSAPFVDNPQFDEKAEDEPYPEIVQTLDLAMGTAVLHVAVLPMTPCAPEDAADGGLDILKDKMIFAVSCVTNDVYFVTVPLTPPSNESKTRPELRAELLAGKAGSGAWGESVTLLAGQNTRSDGIAITIVKPKMSITSERIREHAGSSLPTPEPRVVVAAHSREASGALRLWDIRLDKKSGDIPSQVHPFQTEYLPSPLSGISFNPTHTTQLLAITSFEAVRIYDYALPSLPPAEDTPTSPFPSQGSWLLSLYQPYARPSSSRKPILDAAWIAHGRAILALLADGMWGIWDVDGASPLGATILGKHSSGIRGAALTEFSASGQVEGTSQLRSAASQPRTSGAGDFVPMTPHSRRDAAASLSSAVLPERLAAVKGGIVVTPLPVTAAATAVDETVVMWVGGLDHVCVIPAILKFWDAQVRKGAGSGVNLFSGTQPTRMIRLHDLSTGLLGERCCGVGAVINFNKVKLGLGDGNSLPVEIIVQAESRVIFVREAEDGPGMKIGGVVSSRRLRFSQPGDKPGMPKAIIVHPRGNQPDNSTFNLTVNKNNTLRAPSATSFGRNGTPLEEQELPDETLTLPTRPRIGLAFADQLSAAADTQEDVTGRDVEVEMLDILEIDRALDSMEDERGIGGGNVFFEGN